MLRHLDQIVMAKAEIQAVGRGKLPVNELGAVDAFKDRSTRIMKLLAVLLDMALRKIFIDAEFNYFLDRGHGQRGLHDHGRHQS